MAAKFGRASRARHTGRPRFAEKPFAGRLDVVLQPCLEHAFVEAGPDRGLDVDNQGAGTAQEAPARPEQAREQGDGQACRPRRGVKVRGARLVGRDDEISDKVSQKSIRKPNKAKRRRTDRILVYEK